MEILLDESTHTYTVDGVVKANVSTVLETLLELEQFNTFVDTTTGKTIPADMVKQAGDFGRAFHKGAAFVVQGKRISYPDELAHAFSELKRWMAKEKVVYEVFEMLGYSWKLDICGMLDLTYTVEGNDDVLHLVDYKTAKDAPMVGPQTWAYEQIYREMVGDKRIIKRHVLYMPKKDGEYKFVELKDSTDEHEFKARNYDYHWRRR